MDLHVISCDVLAPGSLTFMQASIVLIVFQSLDDLSNILEEEVCNRNVVLQVVEKQPKVSSLVVTRIPTYRR